MAYLEQGSAEQDDERLLHTAEDFNKPTSLSSSEKSIDRSDDTVRRNSKVRTSKVEDNISEQLRQLRLEENLKRLKSSRSGFLSAVTAKKNEISILMAEDVDVKLVMEKYESLKRLFDKYYDAHRAYQSDLPDAERIDQAEKQYEAQESLYREYVSKITQWIEDKELRLRSIPEISPSDSASQVISNVSSRQSTRSSVTSQLRANEAARMAELRVQAESLKVQQRLEQEKLRIQQEENRVKLEMEIAKSAAKEKALASLQVPQPNITDSFDVSRGPAVAKSPPKHPIPKFLSAGRKLPQPPSTSKVYEGSTVKRQMEQQDKVVRCDQPERALPSNMTLETMLRLQEQQNDLNLQQNEIMKGFALQQRKSTLPHPRVPVFEGNPTEYNNFIRAFENIIEAKVTNSSERLYYLEQFTAGQARELVKSCHHMAPVRGYQEARALLKRNYGNEHKIATAYMNKVLKWPELKPEDNVNLHKFSILLVCCKNVMDGNEFMTKFDNPENIHQIVQKLPFSMRCRWRRCVDEITEINRRLVAFRDLADFVEKEARIATHPVFGNISTAKSPGDRQKSVRPKPGGSSFGIHAEGYRKSCEYCNKIGRGKVNHTIEHCQMLKSKPYKDRIDFLKGLQLCFGCLREGHLAKFCTARLSCKATNCFKKHPTVLHTIPTFNNPKGNKVDKSTLTDEVHSQASGDSPSTSNDGGNKVHIGLTSGEGDADISIQIGAGKPVIARAIIPVKVRSKETNKTVITYAFLDNGSDSSFCTKDLAEQLGIKGIETTISLTTMEKRNSIINSSMIQHLEVSDLDENSLLDLPLIYTTSDIPVTSKDIPIQEDVDQWPHLQGVQLPVVDAQIGILIASDVPKALEPLVVINSENGGPYATKTLLGWAINGPLLRQNKTQGIGSFLVNADVKLNQVVMDAINRDFNESISDVKTEMSQEEAQFMASVRSTATLNNAHYVVALPFKNPDCRMPNNKEQVEQRARWLRQKFLRNPQLFEDYKLFIDSLLSKSYARKVPTERLCKCDGKIWYIPHHGVYHPQKPRKVRVVFDCSCRYKGTSLNDHLLRGPDLTNHLVGVLLRFRQELVAFMADIESMFYQVRIPDSDADFLRFLWWTDGDLTKEPEEYQMLVHLFGAASSPSCSNFALQKTAEDNEEKFDSEVINIVRRNFYVDDCLKSTSTVSRAILLAHDLRDLLMKGGFHLTKWISNSRELLSSIPKEERAENVIDLDLDQDKLPIERALGTQWSAESDEFCFKIVIKERPLTRRGILSTVSSIYDPLGLLSPVILPAKFILQELCRLKLGWDDKIPDEYESVWLRWLKDLPELSQLSIPRCYKPPDFLVKSNELHHFSDASESGYGSVSYLRQVSYDERIHCSLVLGKARVTPLKSISIPRLELTAATVSARIDSMLQKELDLPLESSTFWTDSTAVIRYVENENRRFQTFVANRIAIIRDRSDPAQWRFVDGALNPADLASRGLTAVKFLKSSVWINGPDFLWKPRSSWPERPMSLQSTEVLADDPEFKRETISCTTTVHNTLSKEEFLLNFLQEISSWYRATKLVAWILRYRRKLIEASRKRCGKLDASTASRDATGVNLTVDELKTAEKTILRCVQRKYFSEEIAVLQEPRSKQTCIKKSSPLSKLDPILKDGLLLVGGRLRHAAIPENAKHPVILPKGIHVTSIIIQYYHIISGHLGREYMLALLRRKYWIIQANSAVRKLLSRCVRCRKWKAQVLEQKMADLPEDRLTADHPPFTYVGVDYFGPFQVRRGRSLVKRYGVIFTCLVIRAVHIEISHSLDTDSFILALRRFLARRGEVKEIRSDNGTNFTGGEKELREAINDWNQDKIYDHLLQKHVKWSFNPPYGSHHGGIWERCIRTIRSILRALLKEQVIDDEGLQTLMCEVESLMNARPITTVSDDPKDLQALTPNHLLLAQSNQTLPPGVFNKADIYPKRRWRQVQYLVDIFWKRWIREYLPTLQKRQKWLQPKRNVAVGDVVLLVDSSAPRNTWLMGKVVKVTADKKGLVRRVQVKTKTSVLERSIDKLVLLLEADGADK